jgi:hypothetical protein
MRGDAPRPVQGYNPLDNAATIPIVLDLTRISEVKARVERKDLTVRSQDDARSCKGVR